MGKRQKEKGGERETREERNGDGVREMEGG